MFLIILLLILNKTAAEWLDRTGWVDCPNVANYEHLCKLKANPDLNLKCSLLSYQNPFLYLAPFKSEEIYRNPDITLLYNVLSNSEIEYLQTQAKKNFEQSTIGYEVASVLRSSVTAWIDLPHLNNRIEDITNLSIESSEKFQVVKYVRDGYYCLHHDANKDNQRVATLLFYLNEVPSGGTTIFPDLNITIIPQKGTALFWLNFNTNGEEIKELYHAACPVKEGVKWISTKWLKHPCQVFKRPCIYEPKQ